MANEPIDVLAVMDRLVDFRKQWLPEGGFDLAGPIKPNLSNPIVAGAIERYNEAVEARAAVAELIEISAHLLRERRQMTNGKLNPDWEVFAAALARVGGAR